MVIEHEDKALEMLRMHIRNMYPHVRKDRLRLWIDALLSGKFTQTNGTLERMFGFKGAKNGGVSEIKTRHCCLGVACRVAMDGGLNLSAMKPAQVLPSAWRVFESSNIEDENWLMGPDTAFGPSQNGAYWPAEVAEWFGFVSLGQGDMWKNGVRVQMLKPDENPYLAGYAIHTRKADGTVHRTEDQPRDRRLSQWNDTFGWTFADIANELEATFLVDAYEGAKINA